MGSIVCANGGIEMEVYHRLNEGARMLVGSGIPVEKQKTSFAAKVGMLEGVIATIVLYCSETWALNARERRRMEVFNMKFLRKVLGVNIMD